MRIFLLVLLVVLLSVQVIACSGDVKEAPCGKDAKTVELVKAQKALSALKSPSLR